MQVRASRKGTRSTAPENSSGDLDRADPRRSAPRRMAREGVCGYEGEKDRVFVYLYEHYGMRRLLWMRPDPTGHIQTPLTVE